MGWQVMQVRLVKPVKHNQCTQSLIRRHYWCRELIGFFVIKVNALLFKQISREPAGKRYALVFFVG